VSEKTKTSYDTRFTTNTQGFSLTWWSHLITVTFSYLFIVFAGNVLGTPRVDQSQYRMRAAMMRVC